MHQNLIPDMAESLKLSEIKSSNGHMQELIGNAEW